MQLIGDSRIETLIRKQVMDFCLAFNENEIAPRVPTVKFALRFLS